MTATTSLGFVHACEQNHLQLCLIGGGAVTQLDSGKVVTCPLDPVFVFNYVFGVRRAFDLEGARRAFLAAGRPYVHVLASPSSGSDLSGQLGALGMRVVERQAYRRVTGTGEGAPGLVPAGRPLWLFTKLGGAGDRTATAAGWELAHTADDWMLDLDPGDADTGNAATD